MTRIDSGSAQTTKATPNVYTVLALVSLLALGTAVGCVWYYGAQLTGNATFFLGGS